MRFAFLPHIASETTPADVIQRIAEKIAPFGWHTDLYFLPDTFDVMEPLIRSLPTPVIIDHMGRPDVKVPVEKNEYFKRLIDLGASRDGHFLEADVSRSLHAICTPGGLVHRSTLRTCLAASLSGERHQRNRSSSSEHEHRDPDRQGQSAEQDAQRRRHREFLDLARRRTKIPRS